MIWLQNITLDSKKLLLYCAHVYNPPDKLKESEDWVSVL